MAKAIKGSDGKFRGSIGDGKSRTPTSAPAVPAQASASVAPTDRPLARTAQMHALLTERGIPAPSTLEDWALKMRQAGDARLEGRLSREDHLALAEEARQWLSTNGRSWDDLVAASDALDAPDPRHEELRRRAADMAEVAAARKRGEVTRTEYLQRSAHTTLWLEANGFTWADLTRAKTR